ncbi:hypothetical protein KS4_30990 [Poriferisphaera corsica]|uniref:Uncharacterized protein n=1 Tax=Poriferisphaera corsica TaxID=2528020 RepID=A0A517YXR4_9BACT|nr:hypothetical protein [Poriferisphaera corsica]QDU35022.1 hypothetical protein KS4_30990 [Poriferisphaera corsica]
MLGTYEMTGDLEKLRRLFEHESEAHEGLVGELMRGGSRRMDGTRCTLMNSLPELLQMVRQSHHVAMSQHKQAIRRVLMDHDYVAYETGDILSRRDMLNSDRIDRLADELSRILERVRCDAIAEGNWSDRTNPLEFFG